MPGGYCENHCKPGTLNFFGLCIRQPDEKQVDFSSGFFCDDVAEGMDIYQKVFAVLLGYEITGLTFIGRNA